MPSRRSLAVWVFVVAALVSCHESGDAPSSSPGIADTTVSDARRAPADTAFARAEALVAVAHYDSALVHHETALTLREVSLGPTHPDVAASLVAIGTVHLKQKRADRALSYFERALATYRNGPNRPAETATVQRLIGVALLEARAFEAAHDTLTRAYEQLRALHGDAHPDVAASHLALGRLRHEEGAYDAALTHFDAAARIYETIHGEQHPDVAAILKNIGTVHKDMGAYDTAQHYLQRAVRIQESTLGPAHPDVTASYNNLGIVYDLKGDYDRAITWYERAVRVATDAFGPDHRAVSRGHHNIGISYYNKSDYDRAAAYLSRALTAKKTTLGAEHPSVGISHVSLGVVYKETGDRERALRHYRASLSIFRTAFGERHPYVALVLHNVGTVLEEEGRYDAALQHYRQSLDIEKETLGETHRSIAETYHNVASTYRKQGDVEQALAYHRRALAIAEDAVGPTHPLVADIHLSIGTVHRDRAAYDAALDAYQHALRANVPGFTDPSPTANPRGLDALSEQTLLETLAAKADVFATRSADRSDPTSDLTAATASFRDAVDLIDRMRRGYQTDASKLFLAKNAVQIYRQAIQTSVRLFRVTGDATHVETAFHFSETSKAGGLLDALAEAEARQFAGIPDSLRNRERELRFDLAFYERSLAEERLRGDAADSVKVAVWQGEAFSRRNALHSLMQTLEREYPVYHATKYGSAVATPDALRRHLLDDDTALVAYSLGSDSLYVFTLTLDTLDVTTRARPRQLKTRVQRLRQSIVEQTYDTYVAEARGLYQDLVAPVTNRLTAEHWIVIPDGVLNVLPFETLLTADPDATQSVRDYRTLPYLVTSRTMSYAPAATLLLETTQRPRTRPDRDFLAFAPVFADGLASNTRIAAVADTVAAQDSTWRVRVGTGALPASRDEVEAIYARFQDEYGVFDRLFGDRSRVYLDDDAREARLKHPQTARYRYVHLATHGFVSASEPALSRLLLTPEDSTATQDGMLYLGEVYGLSLNAELVVLSACETGLGRLAEGEGMIGLTRGFLYAGAQNVVVSLWQAPDDATRDVMVTFYDRLLSEAPRAGALRDAKRSMIRGDAITAAPYYWAPFVLVGR